MFDKFGGGETSKQRQAVETISCQAKNVGQFRQAFSETREAWPYSTCIERADSALLQIVFFITSVRDSAEPLILVTFPKI